jgi:sortase A
MNRSAFHIAVLLLGLSAAGGMKAAWLSGKAYIAQHLLQTAWLQSLAEGTPHKPWSWADISPVARLDIPLLEESLIVLGDASGEAMAFGPGLVGGDPLSADIHTVAVGGHRDTHLAFLEHIPPGSIFILQNLAGTTHRYELLDKQIVDTRTQALTISQANPGLVLITCYPFNARQTGGTKRLVVRAKWIG